MDDRLERHLDLLSRYPPAPFSYDPNERMFVVGESRVALADYSSYQADQPSPISFEQARELIASSKLALNVFDNLVQMPAMYNWLSSLDRPSIGMVQAHVADVMIDAYKQLDTRASKLLKGSLWGFEISYRPGHPNFTVLGNCACFGVGLYGNMFREADSDEGFAEYDFHNIDWPVQKVALLAGAGALAQACEIETS